MSPELTPGEVFTDIREWMAACLLLKDQGHLSNVAVGEDEDSQRFAADVRRMNTDWEPGRVPRVPPRNRPVSNRPSFAIASAPVSARRGQHGREPRRRSVRSNPRRSRAPGSRSSDDGPHDLEPGLRVIGVSEFRRQLAEAGL
jgi:hypothetical protein